MYLEPRWVPYVVMPFVEMILALGSRMSFQCLSLPDIVHSSKLF